MSFFHIKHVPVKYYKPVLSILKPITLQRIKNKGCKVIFKLRLFLFWTAFFVLIVEFITSMRCDQINFSVHKWRYCLIEYSAKFENDSYFSLSLMVLLSERIDQFFLVRIHKWFDSKVKNKDKLWKNIVSSVILMKCLFSFKMKSNRQISWK